MDDTWWDSERQSWDVNGSAIAIVKALERTGQISLYHACATLTRLRSHSIGINSKLRAPLKCLLSDMSFMPERLSEAISQNRQNFII